MKILARRILNLAAVLAAALAAPAWAGADLLDPQAAFRFSAELVGRQTVRVKYQIAEGYYLYRDRFRFSTSQQGIALGRPSLPTGKIKEDEFFGKTETYRGSLVIELPLTSPPTAEFTLQAVSQGCADVGICYLPLTQTTRIIPVTYSGPERSSGISSRLLGRLQRTAQDSGGEEEFLPVEQAFAVELRSVDAQTLVAEFRPAPTYYLYRDKIRIEVAAPEKASIDSVQLPRGETKQDPNFGETEVFHAPVQAVIRLRTPTPAPNSVVLNVGFQGCSEKGLCYPPVTRQMPVQLAAVSSPTAVVQPGSERVAPAWMQQPAEDRQIAGMLKSGNFWLIMASFLGFGLLLSFTPCVLPMIPILSGMIAGQGHKVTRLRGFALSAMYVLGMSIAYSIAGVLAGLSGTLLSTALQTPWVLGAFAAVFVILALSMFGLYELQLPVAWQTGASDTSNRLTGGSLAGVFAMGVLSALIVGPCVAAPLAGALLYVSQSRDVLLGGSALFVMALGMGLPLLIIGTSAGALLPKVGAWMQAVKNFFGVLLLAAAVWMISPLIPIAVQMLCWAVLLIMSGIYLRAIDPLPSGANGFRKLWKGVGVIALLVGVALLVGALSGGRDVLQPLSGLQKRASSDQQTKPFIHVASIADLNRALDGAAKPAMLDFYADWCVACKEMERLTFQDEDVKQQMAGMLLLRADVTANTPEDAALLKHFGLFGPPGIIFFDRQGGEVPGARVIGYRSAERFLPVLLQLANRPGGAASFSATTPEQQRTGR